MPSIIAGDSSGMSSRPSAWAPWSPARTSPRAVPRCFDVGEQVGREVVALAQEQEVGFGVAA